MFLHADSEDSDQTGQMPRLIWVFAGCTGHFIGFVMQQLIFLMHWCMIKPNCSNFRITTAFFRVSDLKNKKKKKFTVVGVFKSFLPVGV